MQKNWLVKGAGMLACGLAMITLTVGPAHAADDKMLEQLKARMDALEQQNKDLQDKLKSAGPYQPVYQQETKNEATITEKQKINEHIDAYLQDRDAKTKTADDAKAKLLADEGFVVASDLSMKAQWNINGPSGVSFSTPNGDFKSHIGFYMQEDFNWFSQSRNLRNPSQLNDFTDGTFFRRIRPFWEGTAYDTFEWNIMPAFEQIQNNLINLDEVYVGAYGIPGIGRVRVGHMKIPQGLEGNQWSSSRAMTFQENAAYTEAFYNIFGVGIAFMNSFFDDRMTYQAMFYRNDTSYTRNNNTGTDFGDGSYAATGRLSALLLDEYEDRHLLHVGLSGTYRKAERNDTLNGTAGPDQVILQARPELRDAQGAFGTGGTLPGDNNRLVSTGVLSASGTGVVGTELLYILGPFSAQAEWAVDYVNDATSGTPAVRGVPATRTAPAVAARASTINTQTRSFDGGYVQMSYFLTGETRQYDKAFGRIGSNYIANRPFSNFWLKRDENGNTTWGSGAWEVAARYSYLNLNDGTIQGGVLGGTSLGLNWYLCNNVKCQFEYITSQRWDKGTSPSASTGPGGNVPGFVEGFGTRVQFQY
jgi:phosphate-selective porin OprO and OprP